MCGADVAVLSVDAAEPEGDDPALPEFLAGDDEEALRHFSEIEFSSHFIDAPMSAQEQSDRDRMLRQYPRIFSGHYRFRPESTIDLRGVDQFFPMISEMRYTVISLWRELKAPTFLYQSWLKYLK